MGEALAAAGLYDSAPAFFSWIGVTNYISVDAIRQVLGTVASIGPATRIVLSYDAPREAVAKPGLYDFLRSRSAEYDEPFISFFTPRGIETLMRDCGFGRMVHFGPAEAIRDYFAARPDLELSGARRLLHATALAPGERPG